MPDIPWGTIASVLVCVAIVVLLVYSRYNGWFTAQAAQLRANRQQAGQHAAAPAAPAHAHGHAHGGGGGGSQTLAFVFFALAFVVLVAGVFFSKGSPSPTTVSGFLGQYWLHFGIIWALLYAGALAHPSGASFRAPLQWAGIVMIGIFIFGIFAGQMKAAGVKQAAREARRAEAAAQRRAPSPPFTITAFPNDGDDDSDAEWTVVPGKPGRTLCGPLPPNVELQFAGADNVRIVDAPRSVKKFFFRSTTDTPQEVTLYFAASKEVCDSK